MLLFFILTLSTISTSLVFGNDFEKEAKISNVTLGRDGKGTPNLSPPKRSSLKDVTQVGQGDCHFCDTKYEGLSKTVISV